MKVCQLSSGHESYELRIFQKECTSLAKEHDVTLIIPHHENEVVNGVRIVPFSSYSSTLRRFVCAPFKMFVAARRENADVYHFHDPELIFTGLMLKMFSRASVIYDVHEDVAESVRSRQRFNSAVRRLVSAVFDVYERITSRMFDRVICATDNIARKFKRPGVEIVYNYPLLDRFHNANMERDGTVAVFGNMSCARGIREVCEAIALLNGEMGKAVTLRLIGRINPASLEKEIIERYADFIEYTGWINIEESYRLVQKSSIGLVTYLPGPNHDFCMPNKLFEYMSFKMPVICSSFGVMKDIVERSGCGLCVDPSDPHAIADALALLLDDPGKACVMGERGEKAVREIYSWQSMEKRLFDVYQGLRTA